MRISVAIALCGAIGLVGCGGDDSESASSTELSKGSCLIGASERSPVAIATSPGNTVRVTGTVDVAKDGELVTMCINDLRIDASGDVQIRMFTGLGGNDVSDEITLTASDLATYTSFSVSVKNQDPGYNGAYSVEFYERSGDSLNRLAHGIDEP